MSEILRAQPEENDERQTGAKEGMVGWEDLAEGERPADWESVAEVRYAGEDGAERDDDVERDGVGEAEAGAESVEAKVERLRGWIDLEGIAREEDPAGLEKVEGETMRRQERVEEHRLALIEKDERYEEISARKGELPEALARARHELEKFDRQASLGMLSGVKKKLGIGAKKREGLLAAVTALEAEDEELSRERREIEDEQKSLEAAVAGVDTEGPKQEFLEKFETALTPEEKEEGLDFEALAELSTEEYLRLWRRLNPFFVTHVTRQGIRDHNAMIYHSAGMGEFQEGMTGVLADGKVLRTPAEVQYGLGRELTEESVGRALEKMLPEAEAEATIAERRSRGASDKAILKGLVEGLPVNTTLAAAEPWADKQAVHFAQLTALDEYYGGETGNEALFVFPTDVIASQCRFGGHMRDGLTVAQVGSERKWNDMFVWPQEKDITIDAGLTFLPKGTLVDAETGSKYATEVVERDGRWVRVPKVDEEAVAKFVEWMQGLSTEDEAVKAATAYGSQYDTSLLKEAGLEAGVPERILDDVLDPMDEFRYGLAGFIQGGDLTSMWMVPEEELSRMTPEERREYSIKMFLEGRASTWQRAENAVPAEEYWEKYFGEHPERRPAHVIYYDGDPSTAVLKTLEEAGVLEENSKPYGVGSFGEEWQRITGKSDSHERDGKWLGFEDHHVVDAEKDEALQRSHREFNAMAEKLIATRYGLHAE